MNSVSVCLVIIACAVVALAEPELASGFGSQGNFGGNSGGFEGQQRGFGGNGGLGRSSYSREQQQPSGLPYGAGTNFGSQGRFSRSPEPPVFGENGGFGGSSYSARQEQLRGLPYGANTPFGGQSRNGGFGKNNGGF